MIKNVSRACSFGLASFSAPYDFQDPANWKFRADVSVVSGYPNLYDKRVDSIALRRTDDGLFVEVEGLFEGAVVCYQKTATQALCASEPIVVLGDMSSSIFNHKVVNGRPCKKKSR